MYIHSKYGISKENTQINFYRSELKTLCELNTRRFNKLTLLALLGALNCVNKDIISDNLGIYVSCEYGAIQSIKVALDELKTNNFIMPFNFLNTNVNNIGFYVSKALNSSGKNMVLNSTNLSFEYGLELAYYELLQGEVKDALVGHVDESLDGIEGYNNAILNLHKLDSLDTSGWIYLSCESENSLAKIEEIVLIHDINTIVSKLDEIQYDMINLNQVALKKIDELNIDKTKVFNSEIKNLHSCSSLVELITIKGKKVLHLAMDKQDRAYLIRIST